MNLQIFRIGGQEIGQAWKRTDGTWTAVCRFCGWQSEGHRWVVTLAPPSAWHAMMDHSHAHEECNQMRRDLDRFLYQTR